MNVHSGHPGGVWLACSPFVVVLLLQACGDTSVATSVQYHLDSLPQLQLLEVFRVGSVDDPDAGFSAIGDVELTASGDIFVLERRDRNVRKYTGSGELVRVFSGPGDGPGELGRMSAGGMLGSWGDTVWVVTPQLPCGHRINLFSSRGEPLGQYTSKGVRVADKVPETTVLPVVQDSAGWLGLPSCSRSIAGQDDTAEPVAIPIVRFGPTGQVIDTIGWQHPYPREPQDSISLEGRTITVWKPSENPWQVVTGSGLVTVDQYAESNGRPVIEVVSTRFDGAQKGRSVIAFTPHPFTDARLDSVAESFSFRFVDKVASVQRLRAAMKRPESIRPLSSWTAGRDGSMWLNREDVAGTDQSWVVLDRTLRPVGSVVLPSRTYIHWADLSTVIVSQLDSNNVPMLVRYAIHVNSP